MSSPLYLPLAKSEIRLFCLPPRLHTSAENANKTFLHGNLKTVDLDDDPPYIGLSYVWGSELNLDPFVLNGHEVKFTRNLAMALEHIQEEVDEVTLWIDALCIDQSNIEEKSAQVRRMRDIYTTAVYTLVWLGPAVEMSDVIMDSLEAQSRQFIDMGLQPASLRGTTGTMDTVQRFVEKEPGAIDLYKSPAFTKLVVGYADLLLREWWSRVWVLQEFVVAKEVYFQCGSKRAKLDAFEFVLTEAGPQFRAQMRFLASTQDWLQSPVELYAVRNVHTDGAAHAIFVARHQSKGLIKGYRPSLADLLFKFNRVFIRDVRLKATDPKDKVYALLGLASDSELLDIIPNYAQSVEEIYTETATKILAKGDLFYLQLCKYDAHSALPSWVPDLRQDILMSPNETGSTNKPFCAGYMPMWTGFPRALQSNTRVLAVEAYRIGSVTEIGDVLNGTESDPMPSLSTGHRFIVQIDNLLRKAAALDKCPYGPSSKDIEEFEPEWFEPAQYRIPVADKENCPLDPDRVIRATKQSKDQCESLLAVIFASDAAMRGERDEPLTAAETFSEVLRSNFGKFDLYMSNLNCNVGRKPFMTENGYVGVGPGCLEKGDEAFIFIGAAVPYVLRIESTGRWVLLGDVYIHGVMDGEFIEESRTVEVLELV
jgi:hypothetical protein